MTLRCEQNPSMRGGQSGFTLFEALIALTILALLLGAAISVWREPSPKLQIQRTAAALIAEASRLRGMAINEHVQVEMDITDHVCDGQLATIRFYPDGTASGPDLCITKNEVAIRLQMDPLTGYLREAKP